LDTTFDKSFADLSAKCRRYIREGHIALYSDTLKEMAGLLEENGRFLDELRILILSFYIDLSGFGRAPYIDKSLPAMLQTAIYNSGLERHELCELYLKVIQPDVVSKHTMSVSESLYVFQLCIDNKVEQAEYLLSRI